MTLNMRNFFTLVLILAFNVNYSQGQTAKEIAKNCIPSTVSLILEDNFKQPISLGSGFVIGNGQIYDCLKFLFRDTVLYNKSIIDKSRFQDNWIRQFGD